MEQTQWLQPIEPEQPDGVEIRTTDADTFIADLARSGERPTLVHIDPPWRYDSPAAGANPQTHGIYSGLGFADIQDHLTALYDVAAPGSRLLMWATFPKVMEALCTQPVPVFSKQSIRWVPITGGAWVKTAKGMTPNYGTGYHWAGASELALMYTKPGKRQTDLSANLVNAHMSTLTVHSEKPEEWIEAMLLRWTNPGDLVVDVYAGMAPMARACVRTGRRYLGCEIDEERARAARVRLHRAMKERA